MTNDPTLETAIDTAEEDRIAAEKRLLQSFGEWLSLQGLAYFEVIKPSHPVRDKPTLFVPNDSLWLDQDGNLVADKNGAPWEILYKLYLKTLPSA